MFGAQKAGHAGTLDPAATGILPIALGEATKTVSYAVDGEKVYRFLVRWGCETETDDTEGRVTASSPSRPQHVELEALLDSFTGEMLQTPPAYSAIKVAGQRAYDLARAGDPVDLEPRWVRIDSLKLLEMPGDDLALFEARCGRGTYVRALARDMGRALGCLGHLQQLRRTRVAAFELSQAVTIEALQRAAGEEPRQLQKLLLPIETALHQLPPIEVGQSDAARLLRGQPVLVRGRDAPSHSGPSYAICKGNLIAVGKMDKGQLRPTRVFNFSMAD
jgi:tRNA pseudouridine55 synthase